MRDMQPRWSRGGLAVELILRFVLVWAQPVHTLRSRLNNTMPPVVAQYRDSERLNYRFVRGTEGQLDYAQV